jgi:nucleoside-triphosphatase THEP1
LGEVLFWRRKFFFVSCILFAVLALLESGLQRIAVLTLVYGNDLWKAINEFLNGLTGQQTRTNYSLVIGGIYVLLHLITGFIVGFWAGVLPQKINLWNKNYSLSIQNSEPEKIEPRKRKRFKKSLLIIWAVLFLLYVQSEFSFGPQLLPSHISLRIFIRSLLIVLTWYLVIGPLLKQLLSRWLQKKQQGLNEEIRQILGLIPLTKTIVQKSWEFSNSKKGFARIVLFGKVVLANSFTTTSKVTILTGNIASGKTTSLIKWSERRHDVNGILTPVIEGRRVFVNVHTSEQWSMEASENETEVLQIGKYIFSKKSFEKAIAVIKDAKDKSGWLVVDELGPLELKGEGFYAIMKEILRERSNNLLLVVRENLVNEIINKFDLTEAIVIDEIEKFTL